jgi:hypothetical protein
MTPPVSPEERVTAWAIVDCRGIDVRTVSDTKVAAWVNWLCVTGKVLVSRVTSDERVEELWEMHRGDAQIIPVTISRNRYPRTE